MKKTDLSDNQLKTRPAFPVLVTYTLEIAAMVLMWSFLLSHPWEPFSADAAKVIGITQMTGGLIVLYCFCRPQRGYIRRLRTLLYGGTTIMILPAIIGAQQDAHKLTLSLDNLLVPGMVILLCSSVVFCVCRLCAGDVPDGDVDVREGTAAGQTTSAVSVQDRRIIAAHEAGHALMYAAWTPFPSQIQVIVKSWTDNSGSLGCVRNGEPRQRLLDKNREEWEMLMSLAGMAGENHHTGTVSSGAVEDGRRWLSHAVPWLICHLTTGVYYPDPCTSLEQEVNQRQLTALKASQTALLAEFFSLNHDVHTRLTEALLTGKSIQGSELHPYLENVQLPDTFPRVMVSS
ncbi:hypothetical protein UXO96_17965 [Enterobacter hormaechei]|uniref:hypothetical protein n=1 Tax=Yokenella regensburgei TaxID=158877 RepID=UPI002FD07848